MTFRNLARFSAVGLLAAGALAVVATPALAAAGADLAVTAKGTTVAAGASVKLGQIQVANTSDVDATGVTVRIDLGDVDLSKATVTPLVKTECTSEKDGALLVCAIGKIAKRSTFKGEFGIVVNGGEAGAAGAMKVTVSQAGTDPDGANNTVEVPITVAGGGVDLNVRAFDVPTDKDINTGTVAPGDDAPLLFAVLNVGTRTSRGLKINVKLPEHTTFVGEYEDCTISSGRRVLNCDAPNLAIAPITEDGSGQGPLTGGFAVHVSDKAKGGVNLTGGAVTVETTGAVVDESPVAEAAIMRKSASTLPSYLTFAAAPKDLDPTDDTDTFTVFVADGGGSGGGDGLPVTGPAAFAIGGGGLAVLAAGLVLFFVARRRRIVLVTPRDVH